MRMKLRDQKAITLVALIITIVVLLILAVVAIGEVKNSSIIQHAQTATNTYETQKVEEEMKLAIMEINMHIYANPSNYNILESDEYLIKAIKDIIKNSIFELNTEAMAYTAYYGADSGIDNQFIYLPVKNLDGFFVGFEFISTDDEIKILRAKLYDSYATLERCDEVSEIDISIFLDDNQ